MAETCFEEVKQAISIAFSFSQNYPKQTGFIIAGRTGQKTGSRATLFAEGSMFAGLNATQKDDHPITVQTGHSVSEIIVSPEKIDYTGIHSPDFFVLISKDGLRRVRARIEPLPETCVLYVGKSIELPDTKARVLWFPFTQIGKQVSKIYVTTAALAAMLEDTGMFPIEAFATAIRTFQSPAIAENSLRALASGVELVRKLGK